MTAPIAQLKRGFGVSALLGMGLVSDTLTVTATQLQYNGVERRFGVWRWSRVDRTVHLRDIDSVSTSISMYPWLLVLALICAFNIVATAVGFGWWWQLPVWTFPYLTVLQIPLFAVTRDWYAVHGIGLGVYLLLLVLSRRTYLVFDAGTHSAIHCRIDGMSRSRRVSFRQAVETAWRAAKVETGGAALAGAAVAKDDGHTTPASAGVTQAQPAGAIT